MKQEYDIFISYSRKDYVDENKNVVSGNIVSLIKDVLKKNKITYWMDEEGIYSGDEFARIIAEYIRNSKIFLFISTKNSNVSEWTSDEIATARAYRKKIIPFKYDSSFYNDDVMLFIAKLDFIDYPSNPKHAFTKLINSIRKYFEQLEEKKEHEEELLRKQQIETHREKIKEEIKVIEKDIYRLYLDQLDLIEQIAEKKKDIDEENLQCPVCEKSCSYIHHFCNECGWTFIKYTTDLSESEKNKEKKRLSVARFNWKQKNEIQKLQSTTKVELEEIRTLLHDREEKLKSVQLKFESHFIALKENEEKVRKLKEESSQAHLTISSLKNQISCLNTELVELRKQLTVLKPEKKSATYATTNNFDYKIKLVSVGANKEKVTMCIAKKTRIKLEDASYFTRKAPCLLFGSYTFAEASMLKKDLESLGANVVIKEISKGS